MEREIKKQIEIRKEYLQKVIKSKESSLKAAPQGNLRIQRKKNVRQYYWIKNEGDTKGSYIRKENTATAFGLAQREYDERIIRMAKKELTKIDDYDNMLNKGTIEDLYDSYNEMRKELIQPIIPTDEQNGYLVGDKLIATFESSQSPIDSNIIKCKIEKYLLE